MSDHDHHPPWLARILSATDAPPARASRVTSIAPAQLFSDATNAIRLQFAREDAAAACDDDDATPKRVTSRWRKVKLGLAFMPKKGARDAIAGANEVRADESSSEDEASILRDEEDDDEALEADRDEDEDEREDEQDETRTVGRGKRQRQLRGLHRSRAFLVRRSRSSRGFAGVRHPRRRGRPRDRVEFQSLDASPV